MQKTYAYATAAAIATITFIEATTNGVANHSLAQFAIALTAALVGLRAVELMLRLHGSRLRIARHIELVLIFSAGAYFAWASSLGPVAWLIFALAIVIAAVTIVRTMELPHTRQEE